MKDLRTSKRTRGGATNWRSGAQEVVSAEEVMAVEVNQPEMDQMMAQLGPETEEVMDDVGGTASASQPKLKPWEKGGVKIKRKKVPGAKNLRIRKYVQPKNAVMCLNELQPGLTYVTEVGRGVSMPICVSVEVGGEKYKGFGSSKALAKQAAAEAALISFVKPPAQTTDTGDDQTPWATLASFAIYKLFNEWREGRVGMNTPQAMTAQPNAVAANLAMNMGFPQMAVESTPAASSMEVKTETPEAAYPKPAKNLPENATGIHPSVVLHQMKPNVQYNIEISTKENQKYFIATAVIDGQQFVGEGAKVKKAKFNLAKEAVRVLFGVQNTFEMAP